MEHGTAHVSAFGGDVVSIPRILAIGGFQRRGRGVEFNLILLR